MLVNTIKALSGGGTFIDITSPDASAKYNVTGGTSTATPTLTVTQKPKYVVCLVMKTDNTLSLCVVVDVENESCYYWQLTSSGTGSENSLNYSTYFTISDSSVVFNVANLMGSNNSRTYMMAWY